MIYYLVEYSDDYYDRKSVWNVLKTEDLPIEPCGDVYLYVRGKMELVARVETKEMAIQIATLLAQSEKK